MRFLNAIGFLTIIKIPSRFYLKKEDYHSTLPYFPAAGLIIGLFSAFLFFSLNFIFPAIFSALVIVFFDTCITGAIHADGLADTFDGVFSGESQKARIMEIMKKGDTGVFGALSLIFAFAFRSVLYYLFIIMLVPVTFLSFDNGVSFNGAHLYSSMPGFFVLAFVLVFTPVFGRNAMLHLFSRYEPAAKTESLSSVFKHRDNRFYYMFSLAVSSILYVCSGVIVSMNFIFSGGRLNIFSFFTTSGENIAAILTAVLYALIYCIIIAMTVFAYMAAGRYFTKKIGGLSGDIIG
ncbi:MAG: adenosylcobinamide-GDP ribazoletransferase, partial [Actinobacteria bacterium]|nr:adenosylcobinamide-GDP ribazoletransferase [Actinomycetota bacterium]